MPTKEDSHQLEDRPREILKRIIRSYVTSGEPVGSRTLARAMDWKLSPATIRNIMAERSNAAGNRQDRWQRILIEAAKQSKHYYLPALHESTTFDQVLLIPAASKIMFAEHNGGPLKSALAGSPVLYLIGPEGGWSDRECSTALDKGFHAVSLGAAILKAETAAIVGAALIRYELAK